MRNKQMNYGGFFIRYFILFVVILFLSMFFMSSIASADDAGDYDLASQFAPILYFEGEEECYPVVASYHIQNSYFYDNNGDLISSSPTEGLLSGYSSSDSYDFYYLDNQIGTFSDDDIINDYQSKESSLGYTIYYRVNSSEGTTVIQYWMFYAFNKGELNQHEGDWEMVQVVIPSSGSKWVAYSQHYSGQQGTWDQVEREGDNIKVYVARGSHANFLRSYSGKLGVANDIVGDNGKVLKPSQYTLESLDDEVWLDFAGRWGELGGNVVESASKSVLGQAGPRGPKYRLDGEMWDEPVSWGSNLPQASDTMFMLECFIYNFVMIFALITLGLFALTGFLIYRRHKKYGLGPRILSMLYIDGINLKSIGNILCIIGIVVVIFGLLHPWYHVSYDTSGLEAVSPEFQTSGMTELMKIDGVDGLQIVIPGQNGFSPLGTVSLPFSIILGVGLVFLIVASIGIYHSKKLGWKYLWRGIRILIPIILIVVLIMALGSLIPSESMGGNQAGDSITEILNSISGSPFGSEETFSIPIDESQGVYASLKMQWGLGLGAQLILLGGIIIIIAGVIEMLANTQFFATKTPVGTSYVKPDKKKSKKRPKPNAGFCPECGAKLGGEDDLFCPECGAKLK